MRKLPRDNGWIVQQLPKRGNGSHTIWAVLDSDASSWDVSI